MISQVAKIYWASSSAFLLNQVISAGEFFKAQGPTKLTGSSCQLAILQSLSLGVRAGGGRSSSLLVAIADADIIPCRMYQSEAVPHYPWHVHARAPTHMHAHARTARRLCHIKRQLHCWSFPGG
jgi:hypothetical protein